MGRKCDIIKVVYDVWHTCTCISVLPTIFHHTQPTQDTILTFTEVAGFNNIIM